ncbi:MAG: HEAT repeat domain-containing protein [Deltaproteobacteria bacterium]|nr:HEAT repeat domain-containing protein [Deltaproteobacteria bacterium]
MFDLCFIAVVSSSCIVQIHGYPTITITMKRYPYAAPVLFGLIVAQILATVQVYLSNVRLYRSLVAISNAGYLTVPNQRIMQTLHGFWPAFFGGLFFALSVGAFIVLLSIGAAGLWDRLFHRNRPVSIALIAIWAGCLVMVNIRGIDLMVSAYFTFIPCVVLFVTLRRMPAGSSKVQWRDWIVYGGPVLILAALWCTQLDSHLFLDVRDHLLVSNRFGTKINDFYYTYTLYPAEAFKSLDQKLLKTYHLERVLDRSLAESIDRRLINHDYLRVQGDSPVDLVLSQKGSFIVFGNRQGEALEVTPQVFFSKTGTLLREFSTRSDQHRLFRRFTFFSLLIGFPIVLYAFLFSLFRALIGLFLSMRTASLCASVLCLAIGIALFALFVQSRVKGAAVEDMASALESERWQERVSALKLIDTRGKEIGDFRAYSRMLTSPRIPVRYWLARCLGVSRRPETYDDLVELLDDPHPNVVSMALYALGRRGDTRAIRVILDVLESSRDWYNQWYAYKALRRLGWKQTGLPQQASS